MKIKLRHLLLLPVVLVAACSQQPANEVKDKASTTQTKMEAFTSKTGVIRKFTDYFLPAIKTAYGESVETRIRKVSSGSELLYFYQIIKQGKYSNSGASIEYTDLLEVIKALNTLMSEVNTDKTNNPDYLENKFITVDGFEVGYFISRSSVNWYVKLERIGSDNTIFLNNVDEFNAALMEAKNRIEILKK